MEFPFKQVHPVERVLFVANRAAGSWPGDAVFARMEVRLREALPAGQTHAVVVGSHDAVHKEVEQFLDAPGPSAIILGGGGGTLRAAIECVLNGKRQDACLAPLRMGSGNVLARRLGAPKDPIEAIARAARAIRLGLTVPIELMQCAYQTRNSTSLHVTAFAAGLIGLGQLGRVPAILKKPYTPLRLLRPLTRSLWRIEAATNFEYGATLVVRALMCMVRPSSAETVEIECEGGRKERLRLLAGAALTFPIKGIPFDVSNGPSLFLLPLERKTLVRSARLARLIASALRFPLSREETVTIRILDRESVPFFLDEDPLWFSRSLKITLAGPVNFFCLQPVKEADEAAEQ